MKPAPRFGRMSRFRAKVITKSGCAMRTGPTGTKTSPIRISQDSHFREGVFRHEFGTTDIIDPHDETSMYWGWAFAWDGAAATLTQRPGADFIEVSDCARQPPPG